MQRDGNRPIAIAALLAATLFGVCAASAFAQGDNVPAGASSAPPPAARTLTAQDTIAPLRDPSSLASEMLAGLVWDACPFEVTVAAYAPDSPAWRGRRFSDAAVADPPDAVISFPSPKPRRDGGDRVNTVVLEWFRATDPDGKPVEGGAPAVLLLHNLGDFMFVSHGLARSLAAEGVHAFVMHLPGFARRRMDNVDRYDGDVFFDLCAQAVSDARRARDAIAALDSVRPDRVSIQGTSLGGFITSSAAALDHAFDNAFIMLAGADIYGVFTNGAGESWGVRRLMQSSGLSDEELRELCMRVDPINLAHRLDPRRTWLFSAENDQVVPAASSDALAEAAGLAADRHLMVRGDHYTSIFTMPWMVTQMVAAIRAEDAPPAAGPVRAAPAATD